MAKGIQGIKEKGINLLSWLCKKMPIKKDKIFMMSYYGKGYDCNPKYLTEYLLNNKQKYDWDIVWAFNDVNKHQDIEGIRKVKTMSLRYFYELYTSKVILTNYRMTEQFKKREEQYYIQTWHSSLRLKQIEKDAEVSLPSSYIQMAKQDSKQCNLLISGCKFSTQIFRRAFWYQGNMLECGTPRNDYLIRNNKQKIAKIKEGLGIEERKKVVLYAPTFRKGHDMSAYDLDYTRLRESLGEKWGGDWVILVRLHPHLNSDDLKITWSEQLKDASKWDDIQELLSISDLLISDYSSLMFDFSLTQRPCFLYVPDLENYTKQDRNLYFEIKQLPFERALNQEELDEKINRFENKTYQEKLKRFNGQIGSFEDGNASKRLAMHIDKVMKKK